MHVHTYTQIERFSLTEIYFYVIVLRDDSSYTHLHLRKMYTECKYNSERL